MSLLADFASLTGNTQLSDFANSSLGKTLSKGATSLVQKQTTPKPAPQPAAQAIVTSDVSVSSPQSMSKIIYYAGGGLVLLVVVYLFKKGRR